MKLLIFITALFSVLEAVVAKDFLQHCKWQKPKIDGTQLVACCDVSYENSGSQKSPLHIVRLDLNDCLDYSWSLEKLQKKNKGNYENSGSCKSGGKIVEYTKGEKAVFEVSCRKENKGDFRAERIDLVSVLLVLDSLI